MCGAAAWTRAGCASQSQTRPLLAKFKTKAAATQQHWPLLPVERRSPTGARVAGLCSANGIGKDECSPPATVSPAAASALASIAGPATDQGLGVTLAVQSSLLGLHGLTGGPWWTTLVAGTLVVRTCLVPVTLFQIKATQRMLGGAAVSHMQHLGKLYAKQLHERPKDRMVLSKLYVNGMRAIWKKFEVRPWQLVAVPLAQVAVLVTYVYATRDLISNGTLDLSDQGVLWFSDLGVPDATFLLPMLAVYCTHSALELSFGRTEQPPGPQDGPPAISAGDVARELLQHMLVFGFPFIAQLPAGIFMYWIPSSLFGIAQTLLLRRPAVRQVLGLPKPPKRVLRKV